MPNRFLVNITRACLETQAIASSIAHGSQAGILVLVNLHSGFGARLGMGPVNDSVQLEAAKALRHVSNQHPVPTSDKGVPQEIRRKLLSLAQSLELLAQLLESQTDKAN